ncbi:hypothetical protein [Variovorax boronicumulans]|uniref:hypothetical protein n=1 Tax=Variovorax boronicumulans TaxID=436515 RepID=UPI00339737A9
MDGHDSKAGRIVPAHCQSGRKLPLVAQLRAPELAVQRRQQPNPLNLLVFFQDRPLHAS